MISNLQIRAARSLLHWSTHDLATHAGVSAVAITRIENGKAKPREETLQKIERALRERIDFFANHGVSLKIPRLLSFEGRDGFTDFFDFVYEIAKKQGGDICICGSNAKTFAAYRNNAEQHRERMGKLVTASSDLRVRIIAEAGDEFLPSRYAEYRWLDSRYFHATNFYAFGDYLALISFAHQPPPFVVVIHARAIADDYRKSFELLWKMSKPAHESI